MKKCLTPEERKEKQVAIKYLYRELYERLEVWTTGQAVSAMHTWQLSNLCKASLVKET